MSLNSSLSPNVVKTALDDVFKQGHDYQNQIGYVDAASPSVFKQDSTTKSAEIIENVLGPGLWDETPEEGEIKEGQPRVTGQKTFTVTKFAQKVVIPAEWFRDQMHGSYEKIVSEFGRMARQTRDKRAFAVYRNAFTTATSYDGTALISDSHTNLGGYTVDNKVTGALSETTLNDAIVQLIEMKSQQGVPGGNMPTTLLVAPANFKNACEIVESELRSGTPDNDTNVYSSKYNIKIATSVWVGAAVPGGSNSAWYLLSDNHSVMRYVREGLYTDLLEPRYSGNDTYKYWGYFREVVGAQSFEGIVGSSG